jgi:hypothetical protein
MNGIYHKERFIIEVMNSLASFIFPMMIYLLANAIAFGKNLKKDFVIRSQNVPNVNFAFKIQEYANQNVNQGEADVNQEDYVKY